MCRVLEAVHLELFRMGDRSRLGFSLTVTHRDRKETLTGLRVARRAAGTTCWSSDALSW